MTRYKTLKASTSTPIPQSTKTVSKHKHSSKGHKPNKTSDTQNLPGVQKIKASLRQTRRLLAKDNLAADVRVATERRLHALEKDLSEALRIRKERTMATRYHKVKFFERQKVLRKISQTKRHLEDFSDKKEKKELKKRLFGLRVDLNYILHYPKTKKYVSLFPPEIRGDETTDVPSLGTEDKDNTTAEILTTNKLREEIRGWIKEKMESGELSAQPEVDAGSASQSSSANKDIQSMGTSKSKQDHGPSADEHPKQPAVEEDGFFGDDSEDDAEDD